MPIKEEDRDISPEGLPQDTRKPMRKDMEDLRKEMEEDAPPEDQVPGWDKSIKK